MPNHVTTILSVEDDGGMSISDIRKVFINDKGQVDFDVLIPMPGCLRDFSPHSGVESRANAALGLIVQPKMAKPNDLGGLTDLLGFQNTVRDICTPASPEDIAATVRAIQNYAECGYTHWYPWCNENWGTKWGAYDQPDSGHPFDCREFQFDTAWSHPGKMIKAISEALPSVSFDVRYADEDIGSNCGVYLMKEGECFYEDIAPDYDSQSPADKRKWTEFAFRIKYGDDIDPRSHGYGEDWEYSEEVESEYEAVRGK